jgi:hypothetical protein
VFCLRCVIFVISPCLSPCQSHSERHKRAGLSVGQCSPPPPRPEARGEAKRALRVAALRGAELRAAWLADASLPTHRPARPAGRLCGRFTRPKTCGSLHASRKAAHSAAYGRSAACMLLFASLPTFAPPHPRTLNALPPRVFSVNLPSAKKIKNPHKVPLLFDELHVVMCGCLRMCRKRPTVHAVCTPSRVKACF